MKTNLNRIFSLVSLRICLYVMLVMFASCSSCKKELTTADLIAQLPPETQTGAKTFGCLIDGVPYIPTGRGGFTFPDEPVFGGYLAAVPPIWYNGSNIFVRSNNPTTSMSIYLRDVNTVGVYNVNFDTAPKPNALYPQNYILFSKEINNNTATQTFITTSQYTGTITITRADTVNRIVSGRFSFKAINKTTGKVIDVTDGRFDTNTK